MAKFIYSKPGQTYVIRVDEGDGDIFYKELGEGVLSGEISHALQGAHISMEGEVLLASLDDLLPSS